MTEADLTELVEGAAAPVNDRALADLPLTDLGNRTRFLEREGQNFAGGAHGDKYWDNDRWAAEPKGSPYLSMAGQRVVEALSAELDALEDDKTGDEGIHKSRLAAARKWQKTSCSQSGINAMLAAVKPHLIKPGEVWNQQSNLLCTPGGVTLSISAAAVERVSTRRDHWNTHVTRAKYDPDAQCPRWVAAMKTWFPRDDERAFMRRSLGSCLVNSSSDQKFIVWQGEGSNAKTMAMQVIRYVLGDYVLIMDPASLLASARGGADASPDLARLGRVQPRLAVAEEPERGKQLAEGLIKGLTGGAPNIARDLFEALDEYESMFKPFLICNELPIIRGGDDGIWRRMLRVVWRVTFREPGDPDDGRPLAANAKEMFAGLCAESSGILNWLLDGCAEWMEMGGLHPPARVIEDTREWRDVSDPLGRFLAECCKRGADLRAEVNELHGCYVVWCEREGQKAMSKAALGRALTAAKQIPKKPSNGKMYRLGIELKEDAPRRHDSFDADDYARASGGRSVRDPADDED